MHDLPAQTLLQQLHARSVSGEELEVMGKKAASRYLCGECCTLNNAVVETVKQAGLSPEQVKRVIEFANTNAYIEQFNKLGSDHKYVEFHGGPADPSAILKDLNDGGGGTVFDRGLADYSRLPMEKSASDLLAQNRSRLGLEKTASAAPSPAEEAFERMFQTPDTPLPYAEPFQDVIEMREKLADSREQLSSELNSLEVDYIDVGERLYGLVKQAALEETPLGHIIQAWGEVVPGPDFVKVAFGLVGPRLVEEHIFDYNEMGASMTKTAGSAAVVDTDHPLVEVFSRFCDVLVKLAATRDVLAEVSDAHEKAEYFLTRGITKVARNMTDAVLSSGAEEGLVPKAWRGAKDISARAAGPASRAMQFGVGKLFGAGAGETARKATEFAVEHAPHAAVGLGGLELYDHLRYTPAFQTAKNAILARVPYTQQHLVRQYDLQNQMMGMGI
jgi:hypothetical protein